MELLFAGRKKKKVAVDEAFVCSRQESSDVERQVMAAAKIPTKDSNKKPPEIETHSRAGDSTSSMDIQEQLGRQTKRIDGYDSQYTSYTGVKQAPRDRSFWHKNKLLPTITAYRLVCFDRHVPLSSN